MLEDSNNNIGASDGPMIIVEHMRLANLVRQARITSGLTQGRLSDALGVDESYIAFMETGRLQPPIRILEPLASVLGMSYHQLAMEAGYSAEQESENLVSNDKLADDSHTNIVS